MMPLGSECCKGSKLLVDLFLESYTRRTTHNGILKNCTVANIAIKAFLKPFWCNNHDQYLIARKGVQ